MTSCIAQAGTRTGPGPTAVWLFWAEKTYGKCDTGVTRRQGRQKVTWVTSTGAAHKGIDGPSARSVARFRGWCGPVPRSGVKGSPGFRVCGRSGGPRGPMGIGGDRQGSAAVRRRGGVVPAAGRSLLVGCEVRYVVSGRVARGVLPAVCGGMSWCARPVRPGGCARVPRRGGAAATGTNCVSTGRHIPRGCLV